MKRIYETPTAEKIAFCYEEQVAASKDDTNSGCISVWMHTGVGSCTSGNSFLEKLQL